MPDDIDRDQEFEQKLLDREIEAARKGADIPEGVSGYCDHCDEFSVRLVGRACATCRDKYKLR